MASQEYKDRVLRAIADLPDDQAAKVAELAESFHTGDPGSVSDLPRLGTLHGRIRILPSFFDPLPADLLDAFEGKTK